jgi:hypothetical protein
MDINQGMDIFLTKVSKEIFKLSLISQLLNEYGLKESSLFVINGTSKALISN